ncbi:hypothetical protein PM03_05585 [Thalassobacter stenotrophicus]|uniref:phosphatidylglycerol lysyltransferase domain-containing protein n=1 Tax=Thalassobacter TaxID=266808 RepID=UPI00051FE2BE|nr:MULTISPECIES: phosphatidylglycerol lysyltransferase domain-containing protein [Thalassobacter]KGK80140.1 hypothetical protein PM03_05585 [Thalassobacter stenotrophicus]
MAHPRTTQAAPAARTRARPRLSLSLKQILPLIIGGVMVVLLAQKLADFDLAQVRDALAQISPLAWATSMALTVISFRAVAQYDLIAHRLLGTGLPRGRVLASGASATALAQMLGLGVVTGSLVRWRLLRSGTPGQDHPGRAMSITGLVTGGFLFGWAITTLIAFATLPTLAGDVAWIGWIVGPLAFALCGASLFFPRFTVFGRQIIIPGLPTLVALVLWAAIDTIAAAGALYVLLPPDVDLSFALLIPAFLLALGCGIMSGTPGGFGAFELTLLSMTPPEAAPAILAAIVGFRLTYYVLPAMLAAGHVLWPADKALEPLDTPQVLRHGLSKTGTPPNTTTIRNAPDPLSALLFEPGREAISNADNTGHWLVHRGNQAVIAIGGPFGANHAQMDAALDVVSREAGVPAVVYKAPQALASQLRTSGWWQLPLGAEAIVLPAQFDLSGPSHRQLRRKLRHATKADVVITHPKNLPMREMTNVAQEWAKDHGGERGLSMGRFAPQLLRAQRVYTAHHKGGLIAFVSFHVTERGWMLDLVRHTKTCPDGTMHALICAAINDAANQNIAQLSLDCVPFHAPSAKGITARIFNWAHKRSPGARGLLQFKNSFAPSWTPRYLMVKGPGGLLLGCFEIGKALRPTPQSRPHTQSQPNS